MISEYIRRHSVPQKYKLLFGNGNGDGVNTPAPVHFTITGSEKVRIILRRLDYQPDYQSMHAPGKITGITTDVGEHNVTIKAGNFLGFSPQQILKINVQPIAPTLSSTTDDLTASNVLSTAASINFKITDFLRSDCNVSVYYDSADRGVIAETGRIHRHQAQTWGQDLTIFLSPGLTHGGNLSL